MFRTTTRRRSLLLPLLLLSVALAAPTTSAQSDAPHDIDDRAMPMADRAARVVERVDQQLLRARRLGVYDGQTVAEAGAGSSETATLRQDPPTEVAPNSGPPWILLCSIAAGMLLLRAGFLRRNPRGT